MGNECTEVTTSRVYRGEYGYKVIKTIARTAIQPAGCTEVIFVGRTGAGGMRHGTREICLAYSARKPFAK